VFEQPSDVLVTFDDPKADDNETAEDTVYNVDGAFSTVENLAGFGSTTSHTNLLPG